jgi:hypothetical protein
MHRNVARFALVFTLGLSAVLLVAAGVWSGAIIMGVLLAALVFDDLHPDYLWGANGEATDRFHGIRGRLLLLAINATFIGVIVLYAVVDRGFGNAIWILLILAGVLVVRALFWVLQTVRHRRGSVR